MGSPSNFHISRYPVTLGNTTMFPKAKKIQDVISIIGMTKALWKGSGPVALTGRKPVVT